MKDNIEKNEDLKIALPITRRQQYALLFKSNFWMIFKISMLLFFFAIPLLTIVLLNIVYGNAYLSLSENRLESFQIFQRWYVFLYIPSFCILSIGKAGIFYVFRRYYWNEGVLLIQDFCKGIKKNWLRFFLHTLLLTIFLSIFYFGVLSFKLDQTSFYIALICLIVISLFFFSILNYAYGLELFYEMKFFEAIKNAFILSFVSVGSNLIRFIISDLIPLVLFALDFLLLGKISYLSIVACIYLLIFGYGYSSSLIMEYMIYIFDKRINQKMFFDFYRKGLWNEKD